MMEGVLGRLFDSKLHAEIRLVPADEPPQPSAGLGVLHVGSDLLQPQPGVGQGPAKDECSRG